MNQSSKSRCFEILLLVSLVLLTGTLTGTLMIATLNARVVV